MSVTKKQAQQARMAEFEGWKGQEKVLGRHRILSVELVRTRDDKTAAVFTVFKDHKPTQYVVHGDCRGRVDTEAHTEARLMARATDDGSDPTESDMALGSPPPKEPPPPGIVALGAGLLSIGFDLGEQVPG